MDDEYNFLEYEDKGLSGYYSDRPDFQRMLHDIEMGKIRAVVCYKLDRIGRKTSDLLRLLDFLGKHKVDLLICSNNINTASGVSKIFIQIFAVVAEFERDTLTERITDNMMELAKDGRWLGGNTPTGFTVRRVKTGSGKNKSAYSYLESIPEEKAMIQKLYEIFASTRSIKKTADKMNELGYRTKVGSKFNSSTTRLLLKNPVYCAADESAYNYFLEHNGGLCGDISDFDGQHGISAYNKTDQEKFEAFKRRTVEANETAFGQEIREKYGDEEMDRANACVLALTQEEYAQWKSLGGEIHTALVTAVKAGADPAGPEGQRIAALHRRWLSYSWESYTPQAHVGLAELYVSDPRFTAYYDREVSGCAAFLRDAVRAYTGA